ncbi:DUF302 domain-containing protein [Natrialbaceae archaeon A-gly3]
MSEQTAYTRDEQVTGSFDEVVDRTVDALADEGFGVMWEVDVQATFDEKLGEPFRQYLILGACAPDLAYESLGHEDRLGALLPCNVVVQETDEGHVEVNVVDPVALMEPVDNPALDPIIDEASERLDRVLNAVVEM